MQRLAGRPVDGVISIRAEEHRSQLRNREAAEAGRSALLAEATALRHRSPPAQPSPAAASTSAAWRTSAAAAT